MILEALRSAHQRYPNCRIANCECDSKGDEWVRGCGCLCHLLQLQERTGLDISLVDFGEYRELDEDGREGWLDDRRPCAACSGTDFDDAGFCKRCGQER
jgi:hypothetical protein